MSEETGVRTEEKPRSRRKALVAVVIGRSGDKTVKLSYAYKAPHPLYKKEMRRRTVLHAHDANNECQCGDKVELMETRPLSHLKRWRVVRILARTPRAEKAEEI
ncbi:MAG: 30S ribosomal protein S17 [Puniceicoccales bacterium]|jgi:small subunit ribosomal protein S17|nr:30S ribosomal protein S17 [Puniceicoccales bacterium]